MQPRVLYELSHQLALILERGLSDPDSVGRVPVFLGHPLDPFDEQDIATRGAVGILYLARLTPERCVAPGGLSLRGGPLSPDARGRVSGGFSGSGLSGSGAAGARDRGREDQDAEIERSDVAELRYPDLWMRVRFVFLVGGGDLESQLTLLGAALQTLHDHPEIRLDNGEDAPTYPLRLVSGRRAWRDLGLPEHRLTLTFEVTVNIPSGRVERVDRTLERHVLVEATEIADEETS